MSFDSQEPPKKKSKLPLILGILALGGVLAVVCCGGGIWFLYGAFTAPRDAAIAAIEQNAELAGKLGTPLTAGSSINVTNYQNNNNNGGASLQFNVQGPNGTAKVDAEMTLTAGTWTFKQLTATCSDGSEVTIPSGTDVVPELEAVPVE